MAPREASVYRGEGNASSELRGVFVESAGSLKAGRTALRRSCRSAALTALPPRPAGSKQASACVAHTHESRGEGRLDG
jgi:hypothetical protein